jgi:hypothetical protein
MGDATIARFSAPFYYRFISFACTLSTHIGDLLQTGQPEHNSNVRILITSARCPPETHDSDTGLFCEITRQADRSPVCPGQMAAPNLPKSGKLADRKNIVKIPASLTIKLHKSDYLLHSSHCYGQFATQLTLLWAV